MNDIYHRKYMLEFDVWDPQKPVTQSKRLGFKMTDTEINEACARKLGWRVLEGGILGVPPDAVDEAAERLPNYCTQIEAAWEIVASLKNHSINIRLTDPLEGWYCSIFSWEGYCGIKSSGVEAKDEVFAEAFTAPMAICLAFLKLY